MEQRYRVNAEKLKRSREGAGLTLAGLALSTGMDPYHLALVEQRLYVPTLTALRKITLALGLPTHTVLQWRTGAYTCKSPEQTA
jgi:transcriptional regulator with XRE-family HTH domain